MIMVSSAAVETIVGALILTRVTSYTAMALCHTAAMWDMRKTFVIAWRCALAAEYQRMVELHQRCFSITGVGTHTHALSHDLPP